jgi:hypothetical protein
VRQTQVHLDDYTSCDSKHSIDKSETANDMINTIQSRIKSKVREKSNRKIPLPQIRELTSESECTYMQGALDPNGKFVLKTQFPSTKKKNFLPIQKSPNKMHKESISPEDPISTSSGLFRASDGSFRNTFIGTANFNSIHSEVSPNNLTIVSNKVKEKYFSNRKSDISMMHEFPKDTSSKTIGGDFWGHQLSYSKNSNIENQRKTSIENLGKLAQMIDQSELREMTKKLICEKQKELVDEIGIFLILR